MTVHELITALILSLTGSIALGLVAVVCYRVRCSRQKAQHEYMIDCMLLGLSEPQQNNLAQLIKKNPRGALDAFIEMSQLLNANDPHIQNLLALIKATSIHREFLTALHAKNIHKRIEAAAYLGYLADQEILDALEKALLAEKDTRAKLYISNALADIKSPSSIPIIINSLYGEDTRYRARVNMLLASYGTKFLEYVPTIIDSTSIEIQSLLVDVAALQPAQLLKEYLEGKIHSPHKDIAYRAVKALGLLYPNELNTPKYYLNSDPIIRNISIQALADVSAQSVLDNLILLLADPRCKNTTIAAISEIVRNNSTFIEYLITHFNATKNPKIRDGLAEVLSNCIEYLIEKFSSADMDTAAETLIRIVKAGHYLGIVGFLRYNKNLELEDTILALLRPLLSDKKTAHKFGLCLPSRLLAKLGLEEEALAPLYSPAASKKSVLVLLVLLAAILFPAIYAAIYYNKLATWTFLQHITQYILDFNYFWAGYLLVFHSICLGLLVVSCYTINMQKSLWNLKKNKFLFKPRILPGISIIAPVYCRENCIIQTVQSLLNLRYQDYELIIVNDGSSDETLHKLIYEFDLQKVDKVMPERLQGMPILGVYANKLMPKLLVIDKVAGGISDALNVGISLSSKEYFCSIDADSLLENDALLQLASLTIDSPYEPVALGGNILPINNFALQQQGSINTNTAHKAAAPFQVVEYLQAFMARRSGWAAFGSLLLSPGSFGLFSKERVIEAGGYLIQKQFTPNTRGQDMELAVRLKRTMLEQGKQFTVLYSYHSICFTAPKELMAFFAEREKWQQDFIGVFSLHKNIFFNAKYGRMGLIAFPYFAVSEITGPLIIWQGYILMMLGAALGILTTDAALLLLSAAILYGIVISLCSLIIAAEDTQSFTKKELFILIVYAVLENLGIVQLFNFWRITGIVRSFFTKDSHVLLPPHGFTHSKKTGFT